MLDTEYTISMNDIKGYVSTVPEGEEVGIPQHNYECLIGKVMQRKYPGKLNHIGSHNQYVYIGSQDIYPPDDVQEAAEKFDGLWPDWRYADHYEDINEAPITPAILRERMPELFEPKGQEGEN